MSRLLFIAIFLFPQLSRAAESLCQPALPAPFASVSTAKPSKVIGWPKGKTPTAPHGKVSLFANLGSPRRMLVLPSGNILVSQAKKTPKDSGEKSPNRISWLGVKNGKVYSYRTFAKGLDLPFGMAIWKDKFFVAEPTKIWAFPYSNEKITGPGQVIAVLPFPEPQRHWTRDLLIKPDGSKLYVSVGSVSNAGESPDPLDPKTAAILEMNLDGSEQKIYAGGLRNAVTMAWHPITADLWATVNERDELGDDLVPDYITHVVDSGFYGWPFAYWGQNPDPRLNGARPDLIQKSLVPDCSAGAHTASLGIEFTYGTKIPRAYAHGAIVSQHGSWNRSKFAGYKVVYMPFDSDEMPTGERVDLLTGFIADESKNTVYGRPVTSAVLADGTVLVTDDGAGKIWKVKLNKN